MPPKCSEIASEVIQGQKQSRKSCTAHKVLHPFLACLHTHQTSMYNLPSENLGYGPESEKEFHFTIALNHKTRHFQPKYMHALALSTMSLCQFVIKQTCLGLARDRARARMVHDQQAQDFLHEMKNGVISCPVQVPMTASHIAQYHMHQCQLQFSQCFAIYKPKVYTLLDLKLVMYNTNYLCFSF